MERRRKGEEKNRNGRDERDGRDGRRKVKEERKRKKGERIKTSSQGKKMNRNNKRDWPRVGDDPSFEAPPTKDARTTTRLSNQSNWPTKYWRRNRSTPLTYWSTLLHSQYCCVVCRLVYFYVCVCVCVWVSVCGKGTVLDLIHRHLITNSKTPLISTESTPSTQ